MARTKTLAAPRAGVRLQERLILARYFAWLLGATSPDALLDRLRDVSEEWDGGQSHFAQALEATGTLRLPVDELREADLAIYRHLERINAQRRRPISLKYFQYIAILVGHIFLARRSSGTSRLLKEINAFIQHENADSTGRVVHPPVVEIDLRKLAYWMATGSGKTLVLHFNLLRCFDVLPNSFDNVILLTPNEGLSRQHLDELVRSGIPAISFRDRFDSTLLTEPRAVTVIEITKLTDNKRGGGVSVDVAAFGSRNLLLVDEGHRGASGEVWRTLRARLAENGLVFEYSATFGQMVNAAANSDELVDEYAKAIAFDYSYPHFYNDGFGKDYWIANLRDSTTAFNEVLLLGNLLAFFEQCLAYGEFEGRRQYNIEPPLWMFVGHSVTGGRTRDDAVSLTDIEEVIAFLHGYLTDLKKWKGIISTVLSGRSGVARPDGADIFVDHFPLLRSRRYSADRVYNGTIEVLFGAKAGGGLTVWEISSAGGEIGLRCGADGPYFGVVNVGDVDGLLRLIEANGVPTGKDHLSDSLFYAINSPASSVRVLIGSRKFMEGWDSFRVSNMGLLNIGRGEGSQIIQLFGRGVRLHGESHSLKRTVVADNQAQATHLRLLQTLFVFGVRANYMAQFRQELEREGIEPIIEEVWLPIEVQTDFLGHDLQVLELPDDEHYADVVPLRLRVDPDVHVRTDIRPRAEVTASAALKAAPATAVDEDAWPVIRSRLPLFGWDRIYADLTWFARARGYSNLVMARDDFPSFAETINAEVVAREGQVGAPTFASLRSLEPLVIAVLRRYLDAFWIRQRRTWERSRYRLATLTSSHPNVAFGGYRMHLAPTLASDIRRILAAGRAVYERDTTECPSVHLDRHLYLPLLLQHPAGKSAPPGLNASEERFIRDLRAAVHDVKARLCGQVFVLRNLTRGAGVGFYNAPHGTAFFPDFLMWLVTKTEQRLVFVEPHGLQYARGGFTDPKLQLHRELANVTADFAARGIAVALDSYVLSPTPFASLVRSFGGGGPHTKADFELEHVLFLEDPGYIGRLLELTGFVNPSHGAVAVD